MSPKPGPSSGSSSGLPVAGEARPKREPRAPGPKAKLSNAPKPPKGRPTVLTPAVQEKILQMVSVGGNAQVAARAAGIHRDTFYHWLEVAKLAVEQWGFEGALATRYAAVVLFSDAVERARAEAEMTLVLYWHRGAAKSPGAAQALLRQIAPERYAPQADEPLALPGSSEEPPIRIFTPAEQALPEPVPASGRTPARSNVVRLQIEDEDFEPGAVIEVTGEAVG